MLADLGIFNIKVNQQAIRNLDQFFGIIINEYTEVLNKNFPEEATRNFYKNILSLKLVKKNHMPSNVVGIYDSSKNEIIYGDEELQKDRSYAFFHELFHMSSSVDNNVGFHSDYAKCGYGINEGYTEYLTRQYFGSEEDDASYYIEMAAASVVNDVIGEEKMKHYYMNANFYALSLALHEYLGDETRTFIEKLDRYNRLSNTQLSFLFKVSFFDKCVTSLVEDISKLLAKMYIRKNIETLQSFSLDDKKSFTQFYFNYVSLLSKYQCPHLSDWKYQINPSFLTYYLEEMGFQKNSQANIDEEKRVK